MMRLKKYSFPTGINQNLLLFLFFLIIGFAIYSNVLFGEFCSDDYAYIVDNAAVHHLENVGKIWHATPSRFLVFWTFALNYRLGGLGTFGYHLINVLLHIVNSFLVYRFWQLILSFPVIRKTIRSSATDFLPLAAGLLFLCHPVQTQAVSFVFQRATEMVTLFYLLTLIFYAAARSRDSAGYYAAAIVTMVLGAITKENMITLPFVLVLYEMFFGSDRKMTIPFLARRVGPFFLVAVFVPLVLSSEQRGSVLELKQQLGWNSLTPAYWLTDIHVMRTYLRLLVFPVGLRHEYDYPLSFNPVAWPTILSFFLLVGLLGAAIIQRKKMPVLSFVVFWFFVTTALELLAMSFSQRNLIYEHWLYLPMVGISMGLAYLLGAFLRSEKKFKLGLGIIVLVFCAMTYQRNFVWQNEITFWEDNMQKSPRKPDVFFAAGNAYARKEMYDRAIRLYRRAIDLNEARPQRARLASKPLAQIHNNLGVACYTLRRDREARQAYETALSLDPTYGQAHNNLGLLEFEEKKYPRAIEQFQQAFKLQGDYPYGYYYLSRAHAALGQEVKAKEFLQRARQLCRTQCSAEEAREIEGFSLP